MSAILKNILLTGEPGVGKTTIIKMVLEELPVIAAGFFTEEIHAGKTTKGYMLTTLTGEEMVMAHVNKKSTYKVGKYGVDVKMFEKVGVPILEEALKQQAPLIVVDEIGKMECFSKHFRDVIVRCLDSSIPVLGTLQNFASPLVNCVLNRDDVVLIQVTPENRNALAGNISELVKRFIKPVAKKKKPKGRR
ncbi:NTPase [bacterium]|nr:NTPase [candidate division CSSED10-310 bacterium]